MRIALFFLMMAAASAQAQQSHVFKRADGHQTPALVYSPVGICMGTAILSHGAGGSERGLRYMAEHLQSKGWLAVTVGHTESGREALFKAWKDHAGSGTRQGLAVLLTDADAYTARFNDIQSALDWSKGRCKASFTALVGHSMGAATALLLAGARNNIGLKQRIEFDAFVAMSAQGVGGLFPVNAWNTIKAPVYVLTGTKDQAHNGDWKSRLAVYQSLPPGCKWQGIVAGANHMAFGRGGNSSEQSLITDSVSAFLRAVQSNICLLGFKRAGIQMRHK
jgi:dienelactone hydrolase